LGAGFLVAVLVAVEFGDSSSVVYQASPDVFLQKICRTIPAFVVFLDIFRAAKAL